MMKKNVYSEVNKSYERIAFEISRLQNANQIPANTGYVLHDTIMTEQHYIANMLKDNVDNENINEKIIEELKKDNNELRKIVKILLKQNQRLGG